MVLTLHDCESPRRLLKEAGYEKYRPDGFHWKKERQGMFKSLFHVIIDYNHPVLHLHIDQWKDPKGRHKTIHKNKEVEKEMTNITKRSVSKRLEKIQIRFVDKLISKLQKI